ncbi:CyP450 monooxygenase [Panus rudis PR-1116 ss-1]|nr:CyP450 monooxygenase [Panus rudis PR-1116 ss-1]
MRGSTYNVNAPIMTLLTAFLVSFTTLCFIALWMRKRNCRAQSLPPGPKGNLLVGNIFDLPTSVPWKTYQDWSRVYGDLIYLDLPKQPMVILGSAKAAFDLLDKRSDLYSDRPTLVMHELSGWDFVLPLIPYNHKWRTQRRTFHHNFGRQAIHRYRPVQLKQSRALLGRLLDSHRPQNIPKEIHYTLTATILEIVYGLDLSTVNDGYVETLQRAMKGLSAITVPGAYWVEFMPLLKYIPAWIPCFGRSKRVALKILKDVESMRRKPIQRIIGTQEPAQVTVQPCVATKMLSELEDKQSSGTHGQSEDHWDLIESITATAYGAGADNTSATVQCFFLAMALHPIVQKAAQAELDKVVGPNRLPDFQDLGDLVYIQALIMELLRWAVVTPLAIPHRLTEDDEYRGYFIPKGTVAIANAWSILHDPENFSEPWTFKPERFIKNGRIDTSDTLNPESIAFGFGRRICAGADFAKAAIFSIVVSVLHTFNIEMALGDDEAPIDPENMMKDDGLVLYPARVPCKLTPRDENAVRLIRESAVHVEQYQ